MECFNVFILIFLQKEKKKKNGGKQLQQQNLWCFCSCFSLVCTVICFAMQRVIHNNCRMVYNTKFMFFFILVLYRALWNIVRVALCPWTFWQLFMVFSIPCHSRLSLVSLMWCIYMIDWTLKIKYSLTAPIPEGVRLVDGNKNNEGLLENNVNGTWTRVCEDGFDNDDATVVCR